MYHVILASVTEALAAGFGTAVAMVVLGTYLLRWYRMRQEFALMKLALEKGMTAQFMPSQPQWLVSLRQGMMIVALGVGLTLIGGIGWKVASQVQAPAIQQNEAALTAAANAVAVDPALQAVAPGPPPGARGEDRNKPKPPRPAPPPRDPAREAWDRAQDQIDVCMAMAGCGIILILLGIVRITFVPAERRLQLPGLQVTPNPSTDSTVA